MWVNKNEVISQAFTQVDLVETIIAEKVQANYAQDSKDHLVFMVNEVQEEASTAFTMLVDHDLLN